MLKNMKGRQISATVVATAFIWLVAFYLVGLSKTNALLPAAVILAYLGWAAERYFAYFSLVLIGAFFVFAAVNNVTQIAALMPDACNQDCTVQGWMSATSGWAAVVLAGVGFFFIQRQIDEQKRQTDFIIGDAEPTLDSIQHIEDDEEVVLRIVNLNRRGILIHDMDFVGRDLMTGIMQVKINGEEVEDPRMPIFLRGWEDRNNAAPNVAQFKLSAHEKGANALINAWPADQMVFADIQILGETHRRIRKTCNVNG